MAGFVNIKVTQFFDRAPIMEAVARANKRNLGHAGGLVRKIAKNSIRRSKRASDPGQPPHAHSTDSTATLKNIRYGYEQSDQSVIVGPIGLNSVSFDYGIRPVRGRVPEVLEFGGPIILVEEFVGNGWRRLDLRRRGAGAAVTQLRESGELNVFSKSRRRPVRARRVEVAARPFMRPALEKTAPKFPDLWANSIR